MSRLDAQAAARAFYDRFIPDEIDGPLCVRPTAEDLADPEIGDLQCEACRRLERELTELFDRFRITRMDVMRLPDPPTAKD